MPSPQIDVMFLYHLGLFLLGTIVRYYGFYSNVSRGHRQKENQDAVTPPRIQHRSATLE